MGDMRYMMGLETLMAETLHMYDAEKNIALTSFPLRTFRSRSLHDHHLSSSSMHFRILLRTYRAPPY